MRMHVKVCNKVQNPVSKECGIIVLTITRLDKRSSSCSLGTHHPEGNRHEQFH